MRATEIKECTKRQSGVRRYVTQRCSVMVHFTGEND